MPAPSSSARRSPPLLLAALALVAVVLVVLGLSLTRGSGSPGSPGSSGGDGRSAAAPTRAGSTGATASTGTRTPVSGLPTIAESALPDEAGTTLALIRAGGPFPYAEDDGVFGNRERILPRQRGGYYREYTVETPGERDRGPRRIVRGDGGDLYWTSDHYASFRQVQEGR